MPRRRKYKKRNKFGMRYEYFLSLGLLIMSLVSVVGFFGQTQGIGLLVGEFLGKYFGWGVLGFSVILFQLAIILLLPGKFRFFSWPVFGAVVLLFLSVISLIHLLPSKSSSYSIAVLGEYGGLVGYHIQEILSSNLTTPVTLIILLLTILISILIIFGIPFDRAMTELGKIGGITYGISNKIFGLLIGLRGEPGIVADEEDSHALSEELTLKLEEEAEMIEQHEKELSFEVVKPLFEPVDSNQKPPQPHENERKPFDRVETVVNLPYSEHPWEYPPLSLLSDLTGKEADKKKISANAKIIEQTLDSFGISAKVVEANIGPAVTQYGLQIPQGTKTSKITNLKSNIAMALAAPHGTVRIEAPIPGKSLIGVEVPNDTLKLVNLKSILTSEGMQKNKSVLAISMGEDVSGCAHIADLSKMPHVLIAGTTGSGKSVMINSMLATILFRASPDEVKLILIDPKRVELSAYKDIPHLITPVVTESDQVISALKWAISEMEKRYSLFESRGVRNIKGFNEAAGFQALPYIVIVIDELAELMMASPREVENSICRIAQMARATGIHLVVATQRPSTDVITGLIKANIPCRIAFNVTSMVDSRVIIDMPGAENLIGSGDMLFVPPSSSKASRIQGVYVSDDEITALVAHLKQSGVRPDYKPEILEYATSSVESGGMGERDELFDEASREVTAFGKASTSYIQRKLRIGYNRAANIMDQLEAAGIVGAPDGSKPREVLVSNNTPFMGENNDYEDETSRGYPEGSSGF